MNAKKILVLVGHIASGKSTYCKNAAKRGQLIVNDDSIVNMLHSDDYTLYDENLKILYKSIENQTISLSLSINKTVVLDRGLNISKKGRKRWLALANSFDVPCEAICFPFDRPEVHAKRRAESDSRGHNYEYWLKVALHHSKIGEYPDFDEGFSKIHHINFEDVRKGMVIE